MPVNDYHCPKHGTREHWFSGDPPRKCPDCGLPIQLVVAPNQFRLYGNVGPLDEKRRRDVELQLGERVETREELRALERRTGFVPVDRGEVKSRMGDLADPGKKTDTGKIVKEAMAAAKRAGVRY